MTQDQIEEIAIREWENTYDGGFPYPLGVGWKSWVKAFEIALSKYKWTDEDMFKSFNEGAIVYCHASLGIDSFLKNNTAAFTDWLYETCK